MAVGTHQVALGDFRARLLPALEGVEPGRLVELLLIRAVIKVHYVVRIALSAIHARTIFLFANPVADGLFLGAVPCEVFGFVGGVVAFVRGKLAGVFGVGVGHGGSFALPGVFGYFQLSVRSKNWKIVVDADEKKEDSPRPLRIGSLFLFDSQELEK